MIKLIAFFKRTPGLPVADFQQHWREAHAELVVRLPGLRRYVQNHTHPSGYRKHEPDFDGIAEAWFDDLDALRRASLAPAYEAVRADEAEFIAAQSLSAVVTEEIPILAAPEPGNGLKQISCLNRRDDVSLDEFRSYWREVHGPIASRVPGMRRYVQCHVLRETYGEGEPPCDGVPIAWFDDLDALRAAGASPELERTRADEANFMRSGRLPFAIAQAVEIPIPALS